MILIAKCLVHEYALLNFICFQLFEIKVKRQGRLLRKQIQMQLMEVTKTPDLMRAMHSGPRTPPPAMIDLTSAIKNYPNGLIRPRQDITLNIERPLALDSDSIHGPLDREGEFVFFRSKKPSSFVAVLPEKKSAR